MCYGTLKTGYPFHHLLRGNRFVGRALTKDRLPMFIQGIPYVFNLPGHGHQIRGEVFDVDLGTLSQLDQLEHHPIWYRREKAVVLLDGEEETEAWIYFNRQNLGIARQIIAAGHTHLFQAQY